LDRQNRNFRRVVFAFAAVMAAGLAFVLLAQSNSGNGGAPEPSVEEVLSSDDKPEVTEPWVPPSEIIEEKSDPANKALKVVVNEEENPFFTSSFTTCANATYYGILYFDKNVLYTSGNSAQTPSASVIKVFIMEYAYHQIAQGKLSPDSTIAGRNLKSLIETMIQDSNNEAANILIDEFGMSEMNAFWQNNGYASTVLQRRMLDMDARNAGKDNYTSLDDCQAFLTKLYSNREVYPYSEMLAIMKGQNVRTKIPVNLPSGVVVAHKTGELNDVENDIGIVFSEGSDYAIIALTFNPSSSAAACSAIAQLARAAYDFVP